MESACLRHTELPGTSKLFADFLYHHDRVAPFYHVDNHGLKYPEDRRAALVSALRAQNGDSPSLDLLARPGTVAYVTGQQVGLFSGPAYTVYKALTAVRLAEQSNREGIPAVPVFWLATEDHDFAEVNHIWSFDPEIRPVPLRVESTPAPEQPVGNIRIADWPLDQLQASLSEFPFGGEVMAIVRESYRPGDTMGCAFLALLRRLLSKYGLLFVDPLHPDIRRLAAPLLRDAVENATEVTELLLERNRELTDAGYHAQVHVETKTSLFFLLEGNRRIALKRQNGDYISKERRYSKSELADQAEHISPNALLRPVVQDYILPTASYVGGPAELAYLAQSQVLYKRLLGYMPLPRARNGFTLFDPRAAKLMQRYKLRVQDFFHGEESLREKIASSLVPPNLTEHFHAATKATSETIDKLCREVSHFDPTLVAALSKSRAKILYQFSKAEAKVARETLRRNDRALWDSMYLYNLVMPHKHLQERFYSILPFLAANGLDLIDRIYDNVHLDCNDHILLTI